MAVCSVNVYKKRQTESRRLDILALLCKQTYVIAIFMCPDYTSLMLNKP